MALSVARNCFSYSKRLVGNKLFINSITKPLFSAGPENAKTFSRSLFYLSQNRNLYPSSSSKITTFNKKTNACYMHTKGDGELVAFLSEEIENEKNSHGTSVFPKIEGFEVKFSGAEVELTRKIEGETIVISANVNNSVDAEDTTMDPNEVKEPAQEEAEMKAKPDFRIDITKHKKTLSFLCSYSHDVPQEAEEYNDSFQITEVSMYEGKYDEDKTYSVSGDIMDGYLYDLLMNYLEERGISNDFADKLIALFTAYEHQLYINLLQEMQSFVKKTC